MSLSGFDDGVVVGVVVCVCVGVPVSVSLLTVSIVLLICMPWLMAEVAKGSGVVGLCAISHSQARAILA